MTTIVTPDLMRNQVYSSVLKSVEEVEKLGYTVLYASNYGSHNYNLQIDNDEYKSDIDTKVIILPTLEELVNDSKPVSTTIEIPTGQCDIKDIRAFLPTLLKANIQFLETLCAQVYWINEEYANDFQWFIDNLEELAQGSKPQLLKSIYGMCLEKQKALCHPYPTIKWKIDKWGYDGKQLHHIIRLKDFIDKFFFFNQSFKESIWYDEDDEKKFLLDVKMNKLTLEQAQYYADFYCRFIRDITDKLLNNLEENGKIKEEFTKKSKEIIIKNIKKKILEGK